MKAVVVFMTVVILSGIRWASAEGTVAPVMMSEQTWNRMYHIIDNGRIFWGSRIRDFSSSDTSAFVDTTMLKEVNAGLYILLSGRVGVASAGNADAEYSAGFFNNKNQAGAV